MNDTRIAQGLRGANGSDSKLIHPAAHLARTTRKNARALARASWKKGGFLLYHERFGLDRDSVSVAIRRTFFATTGSRSL